MTRFASLLLLVAACGGGGSASKPSGPAAAPKTAALVPFDDKAVPAGTGWHCSSRKGSRDSLCDRKAEECKSSRETFIKTPDYQGILHSAAECKPQEEAFCFTSSNFTGGTVSANCFENEVHCEENRQTFVIGCGACKEHTVSDKCQAVK